MEEDDVAEDEVEDDDDEEDDEKDDNVAEDEVEEDDVADDEVDDDDDEEEDDEKDDNVAEDEVEEDDVADDEVEDDDDEDDEKMIMLRKMRWRRMMFRMMRWRMMMMRRMMKRMIMLRKMRWRRMMFRMMRWRRMDMSQEPFYAEIHRKNVAPQGRAADFVRACAIDMHMDINFRTIFPREFTGKRAVSQSEHLDQSPTVKTTQVWTLEKTFFEVCKVQLASSTFPANSICYLQEP